MTPDIIRIEIPAKPDYILAVRLAVSAVAERAGFDIEDIEDLKVAAAEACMLLFRSRPEKALIKITLSGGLRLEAEAAGDSKTADTHIDEADMELSRCLLEALVDECDFLHERGAMRGVCFYKLLENC